MVRKFTLMDLSRLSDDKALAIASYGEFVAAYRYIVLAEKARNKKLRDAFEAMAAEERGHRDRLRQQLERIAPAGAYYLTAEDKLAVCVGPRLLDVRDDARLEEAMRLVIASEKRTASFYGRYAAFARDEDVRRIFSELAREGLGHVQRLREIFRAAGKEIEEPCPVEELEP